jgi:hypothetical protein
MARLVANDTMKRILKPLMIGILAATAGSALADSITLQRERHQLSTPIAIDIA